MEPVLSAVFSTRTASAFSPSPQPPRSVRAAREFEAQLVAQLLQSLQKTFASTPGEGGLAGADDYSYLGAQALGSAITAGGGFGIADLIAQDLAAHEGKDPELTLGRGGLARLL